MIGQLTALVVEIEAFDDPGEVFDTLMGLRDDIRVEEAKLVGLNDLITQAEEEIKMKEAQLEDAWEGKLAASAFIDTCRLRHLL
ncbi:hypothetical protein Tco_1450738 [Tanacetum coccineum]